MPTEGCHCTLSHLLGQVTPRSGLSRASWDAVISSWSDTLVFCILQCFLCKGADLMVPASLCPLRAVTALCHTCWNRSHPDLIFPTSPGTQSTALGLSHLFVAFLQGFLCKGADLMVPASLCRLRAVTALCRTCGDRSHPDLVCLTPPGIQSTALGLTQFCTSSPLVLDQPPACT